MTFIEDWPLDPLTYTAAVPEDHHCLMFATHGKDLAMGDPSEPAYAIIASGRLDCDVPVPTMTC